MKNSWKFISIGLVMALLLVGITAKSDSPAEAAAIEVAEDGVSWGSTAGESITHIKADSTAYFYILDASLTTTGTTTATWSGTFTSGTADQTWDVTDGSINATTTSIDVFSTSTCATCSAYDTNTPANTPLKGTPTIEVGGAAIAGTLGILDAAAGTLWHSKGGTNNATTTIEFDFDLQDTKTVADQAVKITSTSDPDGEWVSIAEVGAHDSTAAASATSTKYRGSVSLSGDSAAMGTDEDGVWVQDGDTVTVTYGSKTSTLIVDAQEPTISAISPADGTSTNSKTPTIGFTVTDTGSGVESGSYAGGAITIKIQPATTTDATTTITSWSYSAVTDGYDITATTETSWFTTHSGAGVSDGTAFQWQITATDAAGNTKTTGGDDLDLTIDITVPKLSSSVAGIGWDATDEEETTDGTTAVKAVFTEELDATSVTEADFTVVTSKSIAVSSVVVGTADGYKNAAYLTIGEALLPNDKPVVTVTGVVKDLAGNEVDLDSTTETDYKRTASDGLSPAITVSADKALLYNRKSTDKDEVGTVTVVSNEKLGTGDLTVRLIGPTSVTLTTEGTSGVANSHEGEFTISTGGSQTGEYGVNVTALDIASNSANNFTEVKNEIVAAAKIDAAANTFTLAQGPIADSDGNGTVNAIDITALTINGTAGTSTITGTIDVDDRVITVSDDLTATSSITVSYKIPSLVIEVDNSPPTVSGTTPSDGGTTQNRQPFITVEFDEDEYGGDSYTTVTLTKATLTDPSSVDTDILADFDSSDQKYFYYRPSADMAYGLHKVTVTATDAAGNELTDADFEFTVEERAQTEVALLPGWNLVSLPGTPSATDINTVITVAQVDTVLTYDPTVPGGWLTAVRGTDGNLTGTLTTIDAQRGYWIHTSNDDPIKTDIPAFSVQSTPPEIALVAGWNLVPVVEVVAYTDDTVDADTYFTGLTWSKAYGFDTATDVYTEVLPTDDVAAPVTTDDLSVGKGYWVFLGKAGTLIP